MADSLDYKKAGVDTHKAAQILSNFASQLKKGPQDPNVLGGVGPFAACYDLNPALGPIEHPVLVTSCDGVGTKALLALEWGDLSGVGQDLVAMNVNDLVCVGATPLQFLDYYATGKLDSGQLNQVLTSVQKGCEKVPCALVGGETAEMPGLYQGAHFDLAGFSVGLVDKKHLLGPEKVSKGDLIFALPSSGAHSNGYSLLRKLIARESLAPNDSPAFDTRTWREILLSPTKLYVSELKPVLKEINALVHLTGGGVFENLPRVLPKSLSATLDREKWIQPELFTWIQKSAGLEFEQMHSTFNCGYGMLILCAPEKTDHLLHHLPNATQVGVIEGQQNQRVRWN